jgi:hypothetical protein
MNSIRVKCPEATCYKFFSLICGDYAQTLYCDRCNMAFTFINLGILICEECKQKKRVQLSSSLSNINCDKCSYDIGNNSMKSAIIHVYRFEDHFNTDQMIQYCGNNYFNNLHREVEIARENLKRVGALGVMSKKAMFVKLLDRTAISIEGIPVKHARQVHAYCNFKIQSGHQNAKFSGLLAGFVDGDIFRGLIKNQGLVDIWVSSEQLRSELTISAKIAPYTSRFKVM